MIINERKQKTLNMMKNENVDAMVLVPHTNLHYVTNNAFTQSERLFLYFLNQDGSGIYLVPELEKSKVIPEEADTIFSYTDEAGPGTLLEQLAGQFPSLNSLAIEKNAMRFFEYEFVKQLGFETYEDATEIIKTLRIQKDKKEMEAMQKAVHILEESLQATLSFIEIGKTEVEIAAKLEYEMRIRGSEGTPFTTIVASGYRGALPHGRASEKKIEDGDLIVIDFGSIYQGYVGDMTRTVGIGNVSDKQKAVYSIVQKAIADSIKAIEHGKKTSDIDRVARCVMEDAGYGEAFTHRLGHGIGLDAHEYPFISQSDQHMLKPGMTFTIEPGIYLPNEFGIRIEDNIVMTENGKLNLMRMNHDLIIL